MLVLACLLGLAASDLEEVVVTVRRARDAESNVPLALTVVRDPVLRPGGVDGLASLAMRVPGMTFESMWGGASSAVVLRGLSQPSVAGDNVGVFVDGVYQASRTAIDVEALDLAHIEVVAGPQSALFGQSTFAGAIHYVPNAPTAQAEAGGRLDAGSNTYAGVQGYLSGPLAVASRWRARLAASHREADGTRDDAVDGRALGGFRRDAVALTIASGDRFDESATGRSWLSIGLRYQRARFAHPPVGTLDGTGYNCGARDAATGLWSYFCGDLPVPASVTISPGLPDSAQRVAQVALRGGLELGGTRLELDLARYDASSTSVRDFDASRDGLPLGVCQAASTCLASTGGVRRIARVVGVNVVSVGRGDVVQHTGELRWSGPLGVRTHWMVGAFAAQTRSQSQSDFGADGTVLNPGEQLTALLPATPDRVGPISFVNRMLVRDSTRESVVQTLGRTLDRALAAFGSIDLAAHEAIDLRAELRATHQSTQEDGIVSGFGPGIGRAIPAQTFEDVTARFGLSWRATPALLGWASAAKGSRAGGVNALVGLDPSEQLYEPESNWTTELGLRYRSPRTRVAYPRVAGAALTAYYVDWRHAQIIGFSTTPGINALITRNTAGIYSMGLEALLQFALRDGVSLDVAWAYADPRFRAGSEDPSSRAYCGISGASFASSFCTVGPSRNTGAGPGLMTPYIDGNELNRAARHTLSVQLAIAPPWQPLGWRPSLRFDARWQDDVYDRAIDGAYYGARRIVDAQVALERGAWSVQAWGSNLFDTPYIRAAAGRGANFYPTVPRPEDLILSEGRRWGIGVQYRFAPEPPPRLD
jgi:iron complex outermembrane recepter protein